LIIDEFDKSLEFGFHDEMAEIITQLPGLKKRMLLSFGIKVPFGQMVGDTSRSTDNDGRMISCNAFLRRTGKPVEADEGAFSFQR